MIQITGLSKGYGGQNLFQDINFTLGKGERIGLVGRNGTGKSTLFRIILGEESSDSGDMIIPKNYRLGTLKQHLLFTHSTIIDECMSALKPENAHEQFRAEKILMGLGFKVEDFQRSPREFSGGYQIRINLAKVLLGSPDCLLLDEPTNYLDIVSLRWLSRFLRDFSGEVILITHDRGFMDEITTHTMGIWRQKLVKVKGSSERYYDQIVSEEEIHEKTRINSERKRKDLEEFVSKFRAKARQASLAQSRLKMLEKMPEIDALNMVESLNFEFNHKECPGKVLLDVKQIAFGYGQEKLFEDLTFPILRDDKVAIIGKNGKGKSTLLNVLARELQSQTGSIQSNINLLIGHFGQTNINRLNLEWTIEEEIASVDPMMGQQRVRSICGTMMFTGDLAKKKIKVLSGGERARVLLGKLLAKPSNLLLLDEPTNHLDQESVEALMMELKSYPGAVIIVTHSEALIREVANKLIVFHHGKVEYLDGSYNDFLTKIGWDEEKESTSTPKEIEKPNRQELKRLRSEIILERSRVLSPLKKMMEELEKKIVSWEGEQIELENLMITLAVGGDSKKIQETSQKLGNLKKQIDESFDQLTEFTLKHDELFAGFEKRLASVSDKV
jgi:ATP-binding cassette subfamily F protein 3